MIKNRTQIVGITTAVILSGCTVNPVTFETTPVKVSTPQGTVVCQLYSKNQVVLDRAIDIPKSMSIAEGDAVCRKEGQRILDGE